MYIEKDCYHCINVAIVDLEHVNAICRTVIVTTIALFFLRHILNITIDLLGRIKHGASLQIYLKGLP